MLLLVLILFALSVVFLICSLFSFQDAFRKLRYKQPAARLFLLSCLLILLSVCAFVGALFTFGLVFPAKFGG